MNISVYGVRFKSLIPHGIKNDDILHIIFQLTAGTIVEKKVIARNVRGNYIGCEFVDVQEKDKEVSYYVI